MIEPYKPPENDQFASLKKDIMKIADEAGDVETFGTWLEMIINTEFQTFMSMSWTIRIDLIFEIGSLVGTILVGTKDFKKYRCFMPVLTCSCKFHEIQRIFIFKRISRLLNIHYAGPQPGLSDLFYSLDRCRSLTKQLVMTHLYPVLQALAKYKDLDKFLTAETVDKLNRSDCTTVQMKVGILLVLATAREFSTQEKFGSLLSQVAWEKMINHAATQLDYYRNSPDKDKFEKQVQNAVDKLASVSEITPERYLSIYSCCLQNFKEPSLKSQDEYLEYLLQAICQVKSNPKPANSKISEFLLSSFLEKISDDKVKSLRIFERVYHQLKENPNNRSVMENLGIMIEFNFSNILEVFQNGAHPEKMECRIEERPFSKDFWSGLDLLSLMDLQSFGYHLFSRIQKFTYQLWESAIDPNKAEPTMRQRVKKIDNYVAFFENTPAVIKGERIPKEDIKLQLEAVTSSYKASIMRIQEIKQVLLSWKQLQENKIIEPTDAVLSQLERHLEATLTSAKIEHIYVKIVNPHIHATRVLRFWESTQYRGVFKHPSKLHAIFDESCADPMLRSTHRRTDFR